MLMTGFFMRDERVVARSSRLAGCRGQRRFKGLCEGCEQAQWPPTRAEHCTLQLTHRTKVGKSPVGPQGASRLHKMRWRFSACSGAAPEACARVANSSERVVASDSELKVVHSGWRVACVRRLTSENGMPDADSNAAERRSPRSTARYRNTCIQKEDGKWQGSV